MEEDSFDTILNHLGTGRWNICYAIIISYWYSILAYQLVAGAFMAPSVNHICRPPNGSFTHDHLTSVDLAQNTTFGTKLLENDECSYFVEDATTGQILQEPCTEWDFDKSTFTSTVTSEFQLVCGRKYLRATYLSMYMVGMLVGACSIGNLADRHGRLRVLICATILFSVIALVSAWIPSLPWLFVARFVVGTMHPTTLQIGYTLALEVTEQKMRSKFGLTQFFPWALGVMVTSGWAYLVRNWRSLQIVITVPALIFFAFLWLLGESPRWLAVVGQHQRALTELGRAARWNKVILPSNQTLKNIMDTMSRQAADTISVAKAPTKNWISVIFDRVFILFRTPKMRLITLVTCLNQFIVSMLFFGLTLGASAMRVDPFVYVAISGAMELPGSTLIVPLAANVGRKKLIMFGYAFCAVALLVQPLIPSDLHWLSITLIMVGKMAATCTINIVFLYGLELNPTEIRSQGMCAFMVASRAGGIAAPFIMAALGSTYPWAISVIFGGSACVAGLSVLPLWETKDTCLPDTVAALEGYDTTHGAGIDQQTSKKVQEHLGGQTSC